MHIIIITMSHFRFLLVLCALLLCGCSENSRETDKAILSRSFFNDTWERFDFVTNEIEINKETTYDLSMDITFTEAYRQNDFSVVFSVFDAYGNPYRSKAYKFTLKDAEGNWKSGFVDGSYTFSLPINKALTLCDPGKYKFQIEHRMPITPIVGVKELKLYNNQ